MANKQLSQLETKMSEVFVDKAPKLPEGGKKFLVDVAPWLALIGGVFSLLAALGLWRWAHTADNVVNYANSLCTAYAVEAGACADLGDASRMSVWIWLAVLVLAVEGVLYLMAFPGLRDRKKKGWNFLFYAALLNLVYAVVNLFTGYNAVSGFIGALIGSVIGFWLLFQIRSAYNGFKPVTPKTPVAPTATV